MMDSCFFVSNFNLNNRKGGFDGLGGKIYDLLKENLDDVILLDNINPPVEKIDRYKSILLRKMRIPANFPSYSASRLNRIARLLEKALGGKNGFIVFHGATPWVNYKPRQKYYAFTDCSFETYISNYHDRSQYSKKDIDRIIKAEEKFFANAEQVFFTSGWAIKETKTHYQLPGDNFLNIRQGPSMEISSHAFTGESPINQFVFIGTDFLGKGGGLICNAFRRFNTERQDYKLLIIGEKPPEEYLSIPNVTFLGYVNKSTDKGRQQLEKIYQQSKALLLLTRKDISPLVLIEAGLHGCPSIANDQGAIPEMIVENISGFQIDSNEDECLLAMRKIAGMESGELLTLREKTKTYYQENYDWSGIMKLMMHKILPGVKYKQAD